MDPYGRVCTHGSNIFRAQLSSPNAAGSHDLVATIDGREVVVTESLIRAQLQLDDANGIFDMQIDDIFAGMGAIGYPPDRSLLSYAPFVSSSWRFLVHTILHCLSPKAGSWNQFPSSIATTLVCLSDCTVRHTLLLSLSRFPLLGDSSPEGSLDEIGNPFIIGPPYWACQLYEPEDIDNLNFMEDDTILGGFHEETHAGPEDAPYTPPAVAVRTVKTQLRATTGWGGGGGDAPATEGDVDIQDEVDLEGLSRMASEALGHDQATVPSEDMEEREEEEVPLRRKSVCEAFVGFFWEAKHQIIREVFVKLLLDSFGKLSIRVDVRTYLLGGAIDSSEANGIIRDPKLELENSRFTFDLVPLSYESVDVVVGENWLLRHKAEMVCHEKVVKMPCVPKELVGFTPRRRIGFRMELVQGATPICEGSCRLTSLERQEVWNDCRSCKVRVGSNGNLLWEASVLLGRKKGCVMDTLKFTAMPFGLTNAPAVFMELMSREVDFDGQEVEKDVDYSKEIESHGQHEKKDVKGGSDNVVESCDVKKGKSLLSKRRRVYNVVSDDDDTVVDDNKVYVADHVMNDKKKSIKCATKEKAIAGCDKVFSDVAYAWAIYVKNRLLQTIKSDKVESGDVSYDAKKSKSLSSKGRRVLKGVSVDLTADDNKVIKPDDGFSKFENVVVGNECKSSSTELKSVDAVYKVNK
ncbi:hypothetical protein Tco_0991790 [Tanacetum coccineum]|uniref:Uncharacterized protein n=1 Tax=Tanacetum coccineum TaxID=301880 RepID=A0ABQ5F084_9ASTR